MNATNAQVVSKKVKPHVATSPHSPTPCEQASQLSTPSDTEAQNSDSFISTSNQLTRDYVSSIVANPSKSLSTASERSEFVSAVLGDVSLAKHADNDPPLMRQLESRVTVIIDEATSVVKSPSHHTSVDSLIAVFALVAARWPILVDVMERHAVILTIVNAMRTWSHRPAIVARCMTALRVFSVNDSVRKRVMVDGGLTLTLELMTRYRKDPRIQIRAAAVIANVAFGCTHRKRRIARQGGMRKVIDCMNAFPDDENIQLRGALNIRNLTHETQVNQYIAGNEGAVEAIASALMRFSSSAKPELRFHCVMALESLCREDERNRQRVVEIDQWGVSLVKSMSMDSDPVSKRSYDGTERVNEDGDIVVEEEEVLLPHVTANFRHGEALFPGHSPKRLEKCTSLSSSGCSDRLIHAKSPILKGDVDRGVGGEKGKPSLIRAVVHTIRRDPDDELLVETALSLLTLISMHRMEVQLRIGQFGGVQVAIASIRRHARHAGIVSKAGALVRELCFQEVNRGQVTSGLVVMIAAARDHRRDAETVREIVSALSNAVFENEKNRAWVINKGGVDAVVQGMSEAGSRDVMMLEAGICALRNFVDASESGALCAANEGATRAVLTAMNQTKEAKSETDRFVLEQSVLFLTDVARMVPRAREEMRDLEVVDWVEHALAKLPQTKFAEMHACGDSLIKMLTQLNRIKISDVRLLPERASTQQPSSTSGRPFTRGLMSTLTMTRRRSGSTSSRPGATTQPKKTSMFGAIVTGRLSSGSTTSGRRIVRISARFKKNPAVS